jgi:hypothetical protein
MTTKRRTNSAAFPLSLYAHCSLGEVRRPLLRNPAGKEPSARRKKCGRITARWGQPEIVIEQVTAIEHTSSAASVQFSLKSTVCPSWPRQRSG